MSEKHDCVPPGWKLVPINLTPQQLTAISRAYWDGGNPEDRVLDARVMYGAALAAAPVATQAAAPRAQLVGWWDTTQPSGFRWKEGIVRGDFADETPVYAGALPGADQPDERAAWEYSFIHSSATGRGNSKVGPCLTYDRDIAFGVGCIEQREVLVSSTRAATPQDTVKVDEPRLDKPAQVGNGRFGVGVKWSTVIGAAQRHHEYMNTPELEAERIAKGNEFWSEFRRAAVPQAGATLTNERAAFEAWWQTTKLGERNEAWQGWKARATHPTK